MSFSPSPSGRPYSGYEELDLDADDGEPTLDPWRSTTASTSPTTSTRSRFSAQSSATNLSTPGASSSRLPLKRGSSSGKAKVQTRSASDIPVVLGVAVVDFNHLVSHFSLP